MSELDNAMQEHIAFIVFSEGRPFSFKDFLQFTIDGKIYKIAPGTFRNKVLALKKAGVIELDYNSGIAFYTVKGHKFGKAVTPNHTVVNNDPLYKMLQDIPFDKQSIHDIRLRFKVPNIWKIFSVNVNFRINKRSKDILIPSWNKNDAIVRIIIHKTDVVSIIIGCSLQPILLDVNGIIRLFTLLTRVEEKLQTILDNLTAINCDIKCNSIPENRSWRITMWHLGRDGLVEYTGEKFSITVENAQHILTRLYVKDFNGSNRIRIEKQEYPRMTIEHAIQEKLGMDSNKQQYFESGSIRLQEEEKLYENC